MQVPYKPLMKDSDEIISTAFFKGYKIVSNVNPPSLWRNLLQPSQAPVTTPSTSMTHHSLVPCRGKSLMRSLRLHFAEATRLPAASNFHLVREMAAVNARLPRCFSNKLWIPRRSYLVEKSSLDRTRSVLFERVLLEVPHLRDRLMKATVRGKTVLITTPYELWKIQRGIFQHMGYLFRSCGTWM